MNAPIFTSHHNGHASQPLTTSGIWRIVCDIAKRADLPLTPHDLRRTFAGLAQSGGADLTTIKHALGHSSVQTTERYLSQIADLRPGKAAGDHIRLKSRKKKDAKDTNTKETVA